MYESYICPECHKTVPLSNSLAHQAHCLPHARRSAPQTAQMSGLDDSVDGPDLSPILQAVLWTCPICTHKNDVTAELCQSCGWQIGQPVPHHTGNLPSPEQISTASSGGPGLSIVSTVEGGEVGYMWQCPQCTLHNDIHEDVCSACSFYRDAAESLLSQPPAVQSRTSAVAETATRQSSRRKWSCMQCTLKNDPDSSVCAACDTPRSQRNGRARSSSGDEIETRPGGQRHPSQGAPAPMPRHNQPKRSQFAQSSSSSSNVRTTRTPPLPPPPAPQRASHPRSAAVEGAALGAIGGAGLALLAGRNVFSSAMMGAGAGAIGGSLLDIADFDLDDDAHWGGPSTVHGNELMRIIATGGIFPDMHIDVDNMPYEELLRIFGNGNTPKPAAAHAISSLPVRVVGQEATATAQSSSSSSASSSAKENVKTCSVCLEEFAVGDVVKTLPCLHFFHERCVDRWLRTSGECPVCKTVVGTE